MIRKLQTAVIEPERHEWHASRCTRIAKSFSACPGHTLCVAFCELGKCAAAEKRVQCSNIACFARLHDALVEYPVV